MNYINTSRNTLSFTAAQALIASSVILVGGYGVYKLIQFCNQPLQVNAKKINRVYQNQSFLKTCQKFLGKIWRFPKRVFSSINSRIHSFFQNHHNEKLSENICRNKCATNTIPITEHQKENRKENKVVDHKEIEDVKTEMKIIETKEKKLINPSDFDSNYKSLRLISRPLLDTKKITIPFSSKEKESLDATKKKVEELENYLFKTYSSDFKSPGWHGYLSFQRIFFQDKNVLEYLKDPLVIKVILLKRSENECKLDGKILTISSLLLGGLAANRLSYLITAAPNWDKKPVIIKDNGKCWGSMNCDKLEKTPHIISQDYLQGINLIFIQLQTVFQEINTENKLNTMLSREPVMRCISEATIGQLLKVFCELITTIEKIGTVTSGAAGSSTHPEAMFVQCMDVMKYYDDILKHHKGNHTEVLGYGLVSHALDARHLAATLFYVFSNIKNKDTMAAPDYMYKKSYDSFKKLIEDARDGKLNEETSELIRIRFQQIFVGIVSRRKKLGLEKEGDEDCSTICDAFAKFKTN